MSCLFGVDASWFTPSSSKSGDEITSLGDNTAGGKSFYTKIWKGGRGVFGGGGGPGRQAAWQNYTVPAAASSSV